MDLNTTDSGQRIKKLFDEHFHHLVLHAFRHVRDYSQSEEIVQDVFVKIWQNFDQIGHISDSKASNKTFGDLFDINLSISFKINRPRSTHEIFIDLMNIVTSNGKLGEYYDASKPNQVGYTKQMIFLPNKLSSRARQWIELEVFSEIFVLALL